MTGTAQTTDRTEQRKKRRRRGTAALRRATIDDVAKVAGVHPTTVSAVLNDRPHCFASDATRKRITEAAAKLEYRPSAAARALSGQSTMTLGLVVPGLESEMTSRKFIGFESAARSRGYVAITATTRNNPAFEDEAILRLIDRAIDALAIYPTERGPHKQLERLCERGFPVVTFDGEGRLELDCDDVSVDSFAGGRLVGEHLLACGRRRIALVTHSEHCYVNDRKIAGIEAALADAGVPLALRIEVDTKQSSANLLDTSDYERVRPHLEAHAHELDAIACLGDIPALGVMRLLGELGLRVPEDIALMGIDGLAVSSEGYVPLSTVSHNSEEVGRAAFELLGRRLGGVQSSGARPLAAALQGAEQRQRAHQPRRVRIVPKLLPRASTLGRKPSS